MLFSGWGSIETVRIVFSYLRSRLVYYHNEQNLEQWVSNRFGKRLYEIFFKTYTEKVWGVPCTEIRAEWAAQRIQGLSLTTAIRNALFKQQKTSVKTLINSFHYPERGPGQMWEMMTDHLRKRAIRFYCKRRLRGSYTMGENRAICPGDAWTEMGSSGSVVQHFISSMPIRELVNALDPPAPEEVRRAARSAAVSRFPDCQPYPQSQGRHARQLDLHS